MKNEQLMKRINSLGEQEKQALIEVLDEYLKAIVKFPKWPDDIIHQAAIVSEESGELVRAANLFADDTLQVCDMLEEATQTAAMGFRFLVTNINIS